MLHKRYQFDSTEIMHRAEELVSAASNRYRITVQVANRAKRRRYEDFENIDEPMMKPVIRAIIEMSEELTQPEIIGEDFTQFEGQKPGPEPLRSSSSTSESKKNEQTNNLLKMLARVRKEAENKAAQDSQAILKFAKDSKRALENKAAQDIQAVAQFFEDTKRQAEQNIQAAAKSVGDTHKQVGHYLDQAAQGTGQVVAPLQKTLTEFWNRYWLERLLNLITGFDLDKAKNDVKKLQQDYPHFQPGQIADYCMQEKILWATATGLIGSIVPGVGLAVDFLKTSPLLVEMVYQIAVAYGFEDLNDSARKGELLAVFGLALGKDKIVHLGLGFLLKQSPIPSWAIDASTNVLMFQIVGYTASEFYEAKVKTRLNPLNSVDAFTMLEEEVKAYAEEVISEKKKIAHVVAEAISIKEQLA